MKPTVHIAVAALVVVALASAPFLVGRQIPPPSEIDFLVEELQHSDSAVSTAAAAKAGELSDEKLLELARRLDHDILRVRSKIAAALATTVKPIDESTAREIARHLSGQTPAVVAHCLTALARSSWKGPEVAFIGGQLLGDPSPDVGLAAVVLLSEQGDAVRPYIPKLAAASRRGWSYDSSTTAAAFKRLGKHARGLEPALQEVAQHGMYRLEPVVEALAEIQSPEALQVLINLANGNYPGHNRPFPTLVPQACRAIARFGPTAKDAIPTLEKVFRSGPTAAPTRGPFNATLSAMPTDPAHIDDCKSAAAAAIRAIDPAKAKELGIPVK